MPKANSIYYNRDKNREYSRAYRTRNPQSASTRSQKTRKSGYALKDGLICERCGEDFYPALDFHHLDPEKKDFDICDLIHIKKHRDKVIEEMKKCVVLCATCHRKVTYGALEILIVHDKDNGYVYNTLDND